MHQKSVYICGPLTELPQEQQDEVKAFYVELANACKRALGVRAFVPHEHYDPVKHGAFTPAQVDTAERLQVCHLTSCLVVVTIAPSWGGGIEVEMANASGVPVIVLCERDKLKNRRVSRLLCGNPAVRAIVPYDDFDDAAIRLEGELPRYVAATV